MRELVQAVGTDHWPERLEALLRVAYKPLFERDFQILTHEEFIDWFRWNYPCAEDVQRKSRAFFLRAMQDARIPVAHAIMRSIKLRFATSRGAGDAGPSYAVPVNGTNRSAPTVRPATSRNEPRLSALLAGAFSDFAQFSRNERDAVIKTISLLMERGK